MNQRKLNYIHYYLLAIVASILAWGGIENISICNGRNCMIDTNRLWNGLALITLIFIPITLCIWSEFVNGHLKNLWRLLKRTYEEKILIFGICILTLLFFVSYRAFNIYWGEFVGTRASKEYVAALVNVAIFVATIFAPIGALLLYNNWKIQHNLKLFSNDAKDIWNLLNEESTYWITLRYTLEKIPKNTIALREITKYEHAFNKSLEKCKKSNLELLKFKNLTNDEVLKNLLLDKTQLVTDFKDKYKEKCNLGYGCTNTQFNSIQNLYLISIENNIREIENYIRDRYILMK